MANLGLLSQKRILEDSDEGQKLRNGIKNIFKITATVLTVVCLIFAILFVKENIVLSIWMVLFPISYWYFFTNLCAKSLDECVGKDKWTMKIEIGKSSSNEKTD